MLPMARGARTILLCAATAIAVVLLAGAAAAQTPAPAPRAASDQIVLSGHVLVARGTSAGEILVLHGRAVVAGVATRDVVVLDGPIVVTGQVAGTVVALGGDVTLADSAQIGGDVLAAGDVHAASGAQVGGDVRPHVRFTLSGRLGVAERFVSWLAVSISTLLLGLSLIWLVPNGIDRAVAAARTAPWATIAWGLFTALVVPVLSIALLASVFALPLGLALLLALAFMAFVGYAVAILVVGGRVAPRGSRTLGFLAGWAILRAVGLIPVVSGITFTIGAVTGVGAVVVATWRARVPSGRGKHRPRRAAPGSDRDTVIDVFEEETSSGVA
jgi:hypothetical protein